MRVLSVNLSLGTCLLLASLMLCPRGAHAGPVLNEYIAIDQNSSGGQNGTPANSLAESRDFLAAVGAHGVENFESYTSVPPKLTFTGSGVTATLMGNSNEVIGSERWIDSNQGFGAFSTDGTTATGGSHFLQEGGARNDVLAFSAPVSAVGFFITDIGDGGNPPTFDPDSVSITLKFNDDTTAAPFVTPTYVYPNSATSGDVLFFGVTSSLQDIIGATINMPGGSSGTGDTTGLDDLFVGVGSPTTVPEPSSMALMLGAGAFGLVCRVKRRRVCE